MRDAVEFFEARGFRLPPFAFWRSGEWAARGPDADDIRRCRLGWDVTDFGSGDFRRVGLLLFTIRNGSPGDTRLGKPYAEKIMIVEDEQVTPWHYHLVKMEDIINRGGGRLVIELRAIDPDGHSMDEQVTVSVDGVSRTVSAGGSIELSPGESITLTPRVAHQFRGAGGRVIVGEVSSVNDDETDNYFLEPRRRFSAIDEDVEPLYRLCHDDT